MAAGAGGLAPAQGSNRSRSLALLLLWPGSKVRPRASSCGLAGSGYRRAWLPEAGQGPAPIAQLPPGLRPSWLRAVALRLGSLETAGLARSCRRSPAARAPNGQ